MAIPNNRSHHASWNEHHKFVLGLALSELGSWPEVTGPLNIYHRPLWLYRPLLKSIGYDTLTLGAALEAAVGAEQRVLTAYAAITRAIEEQSFKSQRQRDQARANFGRMRRWCSEADLLVEHESYICTGIVTKSPVRSRSGHLQFIL